MLLLLLLIGFTLHGWHAFTTAGVRLKQKCLFSNFCPGRGLNPGPRSLMAVNVTTRLRRHPKKIIILYKHHRHTRQPPPLGELGRCRIDENKTSLTETRSWIFMQEFLLNMCWIRIVSVEAGLIKNHSASMQKLELIKIIKICWNRSWIDDMFEYII